MLNRTGFPVVLANVGAMADGFDAVAVRIEQEGRVIAGVIVAQAGREAALKQQWRRGASSGLGPRRTEK